MRCLKLFFIIYYKLTCRKLLMEEAYNKLCPDKVESTVSTYHLCAFKRTLDNLIFSFQVEAYPNALATLLFANANKSSNNSSSAASSITESSPSSDSQES